MPAAAPAATVPARLPVAASAPLTYRETLVPSHVPARYVHPEAGTVPAAKMSIPDVPLPTENAGWLPPLSHSWMPLWSTVVRLFATRRGLPDCVRLCRLTHASTVTAGSAGLYAVMMWLVDPDAKLALVLPVTASLAFPNVTLVGVPAWLLPDESAAVPDPVGSASFHHASGPPARTSGS